MDLATWLSTAPESPLAATPESADRDAWFDVKVVYQQDHTGIDMAYHNGCGGPIYAAGSGTVLADGRPNVNYGDTAIGVVIGHSQRLQTWYWHLSREIVSVGQTVETGELIGYEGATGNATGCHLHFQVNLDDAPVNPRNYLP